MTMDGDVDYVCEMGATASATSTSLQLKSTSSGKIIIDPQNIIYQSPQLGIVAFGDPSKVSVKDKMGKALSSPPPLANKPTTQVEGGDEGGDEDDEDLAVDNDVREVCDLNELMVEFMCFTKAPIW